MPIRSAHARRTHGTRVEDWLQRCLRAGALLAVAACVTLAACGERNDTPAPVSQDSPAASPTSPQTPRPAVQTLAQPGAPASDGLAPPVIHTAD